MTTYYVTNTELFSVGHRLTKKKLRKFGIAVSSVPYYALKGGPGRLSGTVTVNDKLIKDAIVRCYKETTGEYIKETTSDEFGYFLISDLDPDIKYFLVISEPSNLWEYRVSSRRSPYIIP